MAILQALLAALLRSMGSILNTAFGWATLMLFGRIPKNQQVYLAIISFGSVLWIVALLGAIHPPIASFLLIFVTIPESWRGWTRVVLTILAAVVPLIVGAVVMRIRADGRQTSTVASRIGSLLRGYPYTLGFAVTLVILTVLVPLAKLLDTIKGWKTTHIPLIVEAHEYARVVDSIQEALKSDGLPTTRVPVPWVLRVPTRVFTWFAGNGFEDLVAKEMKALRAEGLEILLHPSDLVVRGRPEKTATASAVLLEILIFTGASLSWDQESRDLENRLLAVLRQTTSSSARKGSASAASELRAIRSDLKRTHLSFEELERVFRIMLQVETEVLRAAHTSVA